jgi:hypothetical protein
MLQRTACCPEPGAPPLAPACPAAKRDTRPCSPCRGRGVGCRCGWLCLQTRRSLQHPHQGGAAWWPRRPLQPAGRRCRALLRRPQAPQLLPGFPILSCSCAGCRQPDSRSGQPVSQQGCPIHAAGQHQRRRPLGSRLTAARAAAAAAARGGCSRGPTWMRCLTSAFMLSLDSLLTTFLALTSLFLCARARSRGREGDDGGAACKLRRGAGGRAGGRAAGGSRRRAALLCCARTWWS